MTLFDTPGSNYLHDLTLASSMADAAMLVVSCKKGDVDKSGSIGM